MALLKGVDKRAVKVGILESKGGGVPPEGSDMTLAGIGALHEFGSLYARNVEGGKRIPERRWLRGTFEENSDELKTMQLKIVRGLYEGKIKNGDKALGMLGSWASNKVKHHVKAGNIEPDLAESTILARINQSDRPLVDTGQMINSVNYQIENDKNTPASGELVVGSTGLE